MGSRLHWQGGKTARRAGFTLIELIISVAVMVFLIISLFALNFTASSTWAVERERTSRLQNFRVGAERIAVEIRGASSNWAGADLVVVPSPNQMADRLRFRVYSGSTSYQYEYYLAGNVNTGYQVMRKIYREPSYPGTAVFDSETAVTETLTTLAAMYFVREGNRIVIIMVAQYKYGGRTQTVSYTRQVFVRGAKSR